MTIIPITSNEPACFGVLCPAHEHCARYHAAEGLPKITIATCEGADGERPLYVTAAPKEREAA